MSTETTTVLEPAVAQPVSAPAVPATMVPLAPPIIINGALHIPPGIGDLKSFRDWARSEECPERVRLAWLAGTFWVDRTMEQLDTHNQVKAEVGRVVGNLTVEFQRGLYIPDGMLLSNPNADLSTVPDGAFASFDALQSDRVRQVAGKHAGVVELEGTPEMVLEVVSDSSVEKDMKRLPELYARAGIPEFWRIDARAPEPTFEILKLTETGYVPAKEPDGWWRSAVFGRSFQLTRQPNPLGQPAFRLHVREQPAAGSPSGA
jgi:Uma2 family endonuclease